MTMKLSVAVLGLALSTSPALEAQATAFPPPLDSTYLRWSPGTRTATFKLVAGIPGRAKSPFNLDGFTDGELTMTVPESATVVLNFVNEDGTPHSAQLIGDSTQPLPNMALDQPAIPRAYSRAVSEGIAQFGKDVIRFRAAPAGRYRIICGVPGHALSGMWIRFTVSGDVRAPTLTETPGTK